MARITKGMQPAADEVLFVDAEDLAAPVRVRSRARRPNPGAKRGRQALESQWQIDPESLRLYDGNDRLLVRTALLRAAGYTARTHHVKITSPMDVARLCQHLAVSDQEHVAVLSLNSQHAVHAIFEASIGGAASAPLQIQHLLKIPLLTGGESVVMVHNHPSGDPSPSREDSLMTARASAALRCIGLSLDDHVIVALDGYFSFLERGLLKP